MSTDENDLILLHCFTEQTYETAINDPALPFPSFFQRTPMPACAILLRVLTPFPQTLFVL